MNNNRRYTEHHLWVNPISDDTFDVGISDHAQLMLGDIVFVDAPVKDTKLQQGQGCGIVESVKTASDLHAPLDGVVLTVNDQLANNPELLNDAAEETWIFRMRANNPQDALQLMDATAYESTLS